MCSSSLSLPRPLLVGHSVARTDDDRVVILGGGATCFSMGTCWNRGSYAIHTDASKELADSLDYVQSVEIVQGVAKGEETGTPSAEASAPEVTPIPRVSLQSAHEFETILRRAHPAILSGLDLGPCVARWALDYIVEKVGADRKVSCMSTCVDPPLLICSFYTVQVVVHDSTIPNMDFNAKNFGYVTKTCGEFADEVRCGSRLYLRALSMEEPSALPANLATDFPSLSDDFLLPPQLSFIAENIFSSVLRISGPVNMWLHYDVRAPNPTQHCV